MFVCVRDSVSEMCRVSFKKGIENVLGSHNNDGMVMVVNDKFTYFLYMQSNVSLWITLPNIFTYLSCWQALFV